MLLRNHKERGGTGKLRSYWEDRIYVVTEKNSKIPVYTIKPETGNGKIKRVHRNNIMTCKSILPKEKTKVENKKRTLHHTENKSNLDELRDDTDSDDENLVVLVRHDPFEEGEEVEDDDNLEVAEDVIDDKNVEVTEDVNDDENVDITEDVDEDHNVEVIDDDENVDVTEDVDVTDKADVTEKDRDLIAQMFEDSKEDFEGFLDEEVDDTVSEDDSPKRRSRPQRIRRRPLKLTYDEIGGEPIMR